MRIKNISELSNPEMFYSDLVIYKTIGSYSLIKKKKNGQSLLQMVNLIGINILSNNSIGQ